jgi:CHAT domain-containing protein
MVLSACQTAEGDDRATLGLAGMAIKSGARSTLATLWSVNDDSTVQLINHFYHTLGKTEASITRAEALRQAQISLIQDEQYSHPFYWAPFVLIGNWLT